MSDQGQASREMTLDEWVERLPPIHGARQAYQQLREALTQAEQERDANWNEVKRLHRVVSEQTYRAEQAEQERDKAREAVKTGALCPSCGHETITSSVTMESFEAVCFERDQAEAALVAMTQELQGLLADWQGLRYEQCHDRLARVVAEKGQG